MTFIGENKEKRPLSHQFILRIRLFLIHSRSYQFTKYISAIILAICY
jgi:hypothetical protein